MTDSCVELCKCYYSEGWRREHKLTTLARTGQSPVGGQTDACLNSRLSRQTAIRVLVVCAAVGLFVVRALLLGGGTYAPSE